jgi:hypothetical protein
MSEPTIEIVANNYYSLYENQQSYFSFTYKCGCACGCHAINSYLQNGQALSDIKIILSWELIVVSSP